MMQVSCLAADQRTKQPRSRLLIEERCRITGRRAQLEDRGDSIASLETQGQVVGARESLNERKIIARRKVPENFYVFLPNQKAEGRRPFGTGLVRHCPQGLFSPFFTFLHAIFSRSFRLSLDPTICPWVSEDDSIDSITPFDSPQSLD